MKIKLKISSENLYYYILILLLLNNWWGDLRVFRNIYLFVKPLLLCITLFLILALFLIKEYKVIELSIIAALTAAGIYTSYLTDSKWTLYCMILIAFSRKTNIKRTIKITYNCMSIFIIISVTIFLFQYIFLPSTLTLHEDYTSVIKYSMTFIGANEAARYWIYWFSLYLYLNSGKPISFFKKIVLIIITLFFYACTYSDALLLILIMAFLKLMEHKESFKKLVTKNSGYFFSILWIFSLIILKFEDSFLYNILNKFTTGRLRLGITGFKIYNVSILGQQALEFGFWITNTSIRLVLDNAYYMIMIQYGIFYLILISFLFIKANKMLDYKSSCCLIMYSIFALAENNILSPTAIFPVLIAANLCWTYRKSNLI